MNSNNIFLSTEVTDEDLANAIKDEHGVLYSNDGKRLLKCTNEKLTQYTIKDGTEVICNSPFRGREYSDRYRFWSSWACKDLNTINIPDSVILIAGNAFEDCKQLTGIEVNTNNPHYCSKDGVLFSKDMKTLVKFPCALKSLHYEIPDCITTIGCYAFDGCRSMTGISIPNSVTSIGSSAFRCCTGLAEITIPNSVTSIDNYAFWCCERINQITIPDSVTMGGEYLLGRCLKLLSVSIGKGMKVISKGAFSDCASLAEVCIPNSVEAIDASAFNGCRDLNRFEVAKGNEYFCTIDGILFSKDMTTLVRFPIGSSQTHYEIPANVTIIGKYAFAYCKNLSSITISNNVITIGESAFSHCEGLCSINIPNSVITIGSDAFWGCEKLSKLIIPNGVQRIEAGTFSGCMGLSSMIIPNSVTTIDAMAFACCSHLSQIIIGSGVTEIKHGAFYYCDGLKKMTLLNSTPPNFDKSKIFRGNGFDKRKCILYVPNGSKKAYSEAEGWKDFYNNYNMEEIKGLEEWYDILLDDKANLDKLKKSYECGKAEDQFYIGMRNYDGRGAYKNVVEAVRWFKLAARQGHKDAQYHLGECYHDGKGVAQNYAMAVYWYKKAAEQGHEDAQYYLGKCYQNGEGVAQEYAMAVDWYMRAAEQNNFLAIEKLAIFYENGLGVPQNYEKMFDCWMRLAEMGNLDALCKIGECYEKGLGVSQDYEKMIKYLRDAAEEGSVCAARKLAECYEKGIGVSQDYREAEYWYRKVHDNAPIGYDYEDGLDEDNYYDNGRHYGEYAGTYAQDVAGLSDEFIDDVLDGEPDAYWNID